MAPAPGVQAQSHAVSQGVLILGVT